VLIKVLLNATACYPARILAGLTLCVAPWPKQP
jgi:hypothetical protein